MRFAFIYLIISFSLNCLGQSRGTLKGVVKDKSSKEELFGSNIFLLNSPEFGASADLNGEFSFSVPAGSHKFVVSFVGMKNDTIGLTINPNEIKKIEIFLQSMEEVLGEVVVTAGKFNHKIEDLTK